MGREFVDPTREMGRDLSADARCGNARGRLEATRCYRRSCCYYPAERKLEPAHTNGLDSRHEKCPHCCETQHPEWHRSQRQCVRRPAVEKREKMTKQDLSTRIGKPHVGHESDCTRVNAFVCVAVHQRFAGQRFVGRIPRGVTMDRAPDLNARSEAMDRTRRPCPEIAPPGSLWFVHKGDPQWTLVGRLGGYGP
jgi:hypothetical protein